MSEVDTRGYDKHIRSARITLYVLAGFQLIALVALQSIVEETARNLTIAISLGFAAFFIGCALYSKKKPLVALTTATVVYAALLLFQFIFNPASIISIRILIQAGMLVFLIRGIQNAKELEKVKRNFGQ